MTVPHLPVKRAERMPALPSGQPPW